MVENLREILLGVLTAVLTAALGWTGRTFLWRRKLRRKQRFFGLPDESACLLVVNRHASAPSDHSVNRRDVYALLELSAVIKECGAHAEFVSHDAARQGFGERTEFCIGGPTSNRRTAAHLQALLPGVRVNTEHGLGPDGGAFTVGSERYRYEDGLREHVLLARLTAGRNGGTRPVFLICGQSAITNQAAARHLARNYAQLARKHGTDRSFCLVLKVVNSQAYGPDVVEQVADVSSAALSPLPHAAPNPRTTERNPAS
ncbi:hypothetical protein [Streptomyces sp. ODS28]|uniref:hypothetical protein n=1 Tax=Streptomyces sp. ODS28 TaxID=3136688 RepID=UPI0031E72DE1